MISKAIFIITLVLTLTSLPSCSLALKRDLAGTWQDHTGSKFTFYLEGTVEWPYAQGDSSYRVLDERHIEVKYYDQQGNIHKSKFYVELKSDTELELLDTTQLAKINLKKVPNPY